MRRTGVASLLIALVAASAGVGWLVGRSRGPTLPSIPPLPPPSVAVTVGSIEETITLSGGVGYPTPRILRLATGSGVMTSAAPIGTVLTEGMAPFELELRPLVLLQGERPMFREITLRTEGADVVQLQAALQRLGHYTGELDGVFGPGTRESWKSLQSQVGASMEDSVGPTDVVFTSRLPARLDEILYSVGEAASGDLAVLTDPSALVIAEISRADALAIEAGMKARVSGLGKGEFAEGSVSHVGQGEDIDDTRSHVVAVSIGGALAQYEGLPLQVTIVLASSPTEGLVIPAAALRTDAAGSSYVTNIVGLQTTRIPVEVVYSTPTQVLINADLSDGDRISIGS